jgi:hypothetical protein
VVSDGDQSLRVDITAEGAGFNIQPETIKEDLSARREPVRLGINLTKPVIRAVVRLTIKPEG